jgi:hypothetical protein
MDRKKLLVAGGLIGLIICLFPAFMVISFGLNLVSEMFKIGTYDADTGSFNNSTPELTAVSIAKLHFGEGFSRVTVDDVYLTPDGKYWKVNISTSGLDSHGQVTIDAKTLMSKGDDEKVWMSLDELKASYIADIQTNGPQSVGSNGEPQKITMGGKEIWKVSTQYDDMDGTGPHVAYVYVDLVTGKSKNTLPSFNKAAGTNGWLTLKEVDNVINKEFRDVLRDSYPE